MDDIESMQSDKYDTWGYVSSRLRFGKGLGAAAETILTLAAGRFLPEKPILTLVEDRPGDVHGIVHLPSRRLPLKTGPKPKEAASDAPAVSIDEPLHNIVDRFLDYGQYLARTVRQLGYPKSKELLASLVDGLKPGKHRRRAMANSFTDGQKKEAVIGLASRTACTTV